MRVLTLEIIVWIIGSVYFILTPHLASSTLAGSSKSICEENVTKTEVREESDTKWVWKWWWIFPYYGIDTEITSVNETIHTPEQTCCESFTNINQTCFPKKNIESEPEVCTVRMFYQTECYEVLKLNTDLKECSTILVKNNSRSKNSEKSSEPCNHDKNCTVGWIITPCSPRCEPECENGWCTKKTVCACLSNFRIDDTGTKCVPLCDNKCNHGHCVAKNKCECDKGWEGALCDVAVRCRLVENDENNSEISDNSTSFWELPICHSGCRENINGTTIQETRTILINSTCNAEVMGFLIIHGHWIFLTSVLIVLVCFITCIACCIKKLKKSVDPSNGLELIPSTTTNHMEENDLYATTKTTF